MTGKSKIPICGFYLTRRVSFASFRVLRSTRNRNLGRFVRGFRPAPKVAYVRTTDTCGDDRRYDDHYAAGRMGVFFFHTHVKLPGAHLFIFSAHHFLYKRVHGWTEEKKKTRFYLFDSLARPTDRLSRVTRSRKSFSVPPDFFFPDLVFSPYFFFFFFTPFCSTAHRLSITKPPSQPCARMCAVYTYEIRPVLFFFPPAFSRALISYASRSDVSPRPRRTSRNIYSLPAAAASRSIAPVTCNALETFQTVDGGGGERETHRSGKCFGFENVPHTHDTFGVTLGISLRRNALLWASCKRLSANEEIKN